MVCQLMSTSRKNMALIRGATVNIVTSRGYLALFPIPQVWQVEELDRKKVTFTAHLYQDNSLSSILRAAERYADTTPEELERRRRRGWGPNVADDVRTPLHISFHHRLITNTLPRLCLKVVPRHQGLRFPSPLCNYKRPSTPCQAHQSSQRNSSNMIPRSP